MSGRSTHLRRPTVLQEHGEHLREHDDALEALREDVGTVKTDVAVIRARLTMTLAIAGALGTALLSLAVALAIVVLTGGAGVDETIAALQAVVQAVAQ